MDAALVTSLEAMVSPGRLKRYKDAGTTDLETATLYVWNIELAESLLPSIAILEVALRNAVHNVLSTIHGDYWFRAVLQPQRYAVVAALIAELTRKHGPQLPVGKVIAELTFGFWPHLFAKHYRYVWWSPPHSLLNSVLSNHPKVLPSTRGELMRRLLYINNLRNRAMHHEAIFQGVASVNNPVLPLDVLHAQILETIEWINPSACRLLSCLDRFPTVFSSAGKLRIENAIRAEFTIV